MVDIIHTQVVDAKCLAIFDLVGSLLGPSMNRWTKPFIPLKKRESKMGLLSPIFNDLTELVLVLS